MAKAISPSFEDALRKCKLVDLTTLDKVVAQLKLELGEKPRDEVLGERLVEMKLITEWQFDVLKDGTQDTLMDGRHKGFFLGSYKIVGHLGTGGMNSVYLAEHVVMRRQAAIKVLPLNGDEDSAFLERFQRESQATAALDHPNIVRAHDFGTQGQVHYLVMEFVPGKDLQRMVKDHGPMAYETAADYIRQAALGVEHAHEAGMVHRDIKPANLLVDLKGTVKLLDLGVARVNTNKDDASLTKEHKENILGTADYLAPEQAIDSHNVDARADIYSLGCTLYFLLTGHPPFPHGSLAQRMLMHQIQTPASIYDDRPDAPPELVAICEKMMAKKAPDRIQNAGDVAAALTTWLGERTGDGSGTGSGLSLRKSGGNSSAGLEAAGLGFDTSSLFGPSKGSDTTRSGDSGTDQKINCRTCGTSFSRNVHRAKCPKCGTQNEVAVGDSGRPTSNAGLSGLSAGFSGGQGLTGGGSNSGLSGLSGLGGGYGGGVLSSDGSEAAARGGVDMGPVTTGGSAIGLGKGIVPGMGSGSGSGLGRPGAGSGVGVGGSGSNIGRGPGGSDANRAAAAAAKGPAPKTEGNVRASCPTCGATYSAPWKTCFHCGGATIVADMPAAAPAGDSNAALGAGSAAGLPANRRSGYFPAVPAPAVEPEAEPVQDEYGYEEPPSRLSAAEHNSNSRAEHNRPSAAEHVRPSQAEHNRPSGVGRPSASEAKQRWVDEDQPSDGGYAIDSDRDDDPSSISEASAIEDLRSLRRRKPKNKVVPIVALCVILAAIGGGGFLFLQQSAAPDGPKYDNGQLKFQGKLENEREVGPWVFWSPEGQKTKQGEYRDGKQIGRWIFWNEKGQIEKSGEFVDGAEHGAWVFRYPDGQKKEEVEFRSGKRQGHGVLWHPNGFRKAEGEYADDKPVGVWEEWDEQGQPTKTAPAKSEPAKTAPAKSEPEKKADVKTPDKKSS